MVLFEDGHSGNDKPIFCFLAEGVVAYPVTEFGSDRALIFMMFTQLPANGQTTVPVDI